MPKYSYKLEPATEAAVVRQMIADPVVLPKIHRNLKADAFDTAEAKILVSAALAFFKERGTAPTRTALMQELRERKNKGRLTSVELSVCAEFMEEALHHSPLGSDYVVDLLLGKERHEALWQALEEGTRLHADGKVDDVIKVISRADIIGKVDREIGVDYGHDIDRRTEMRLRNTQPKRWGTGILALDELLNGGPSLDNPLACIQAGPKNGKSLFLIHVALNTVALGGACFFASVENGQEQVLLNMDASISGVPMDDVHANANEVRAKVRAWRESVGGRLHVKKFPQGTTTVRDVESYMDLLAMELDFRPDVVMVDYPNEMAVIDPSKFGKRHEELAEIYRSLKTMSERRRVITWTAAQLTKEGAERKTAAKGDAGGAFAIEQLVDVMVAIGRTEEEKAAGRVRFGITESRFCRDGEVTEAIPSAYEMGRIVAEGIPRQLR